MEQLSEANVHGMKPRMLEGNLFLDTGKVPWTPFFINDIEFKILNVEGSTSTLLVRVAKGAKLTMHRHLFPVEFFLIEGSFGYADAETGKENWIGPMGFLYEPPGTVHQPLCPDGALGVAVFHGPVAGFDKDGNEIVIGIEDYYQRAKENNAVAHLRYKG